MLFTKYKKLLIIYQWLSFNKVLFSSEGYGWGTLKNTNYLSSTSLSQVLWQSAHSFDGKNT